MTKPSSRLNTPNQSDRVWFNEVMQAGGKDFFSDPAYHLNDFKSERGKFIYPLEPERITWQRAELIRKHGKPHPNLWLSRIDLFLITVEGNGWERIFSANLAGIDRASHLRAQALSRERLSGNATIEGQTYWELISTLTSDLLITLNGDAAFVSPVLHHLASGELLPLNPMGESEPLFTREKYGTTPRLDRRNREWLRQHTRLQEHESINLTLDRHGLVIEQKK